MSVKKIKAVKPPPTPPLPPQVGSGVVDARAGVRAGKGRPPAGTWATWEGADVSMGQAWSRAQKLRDQFRTGPNPIPLPSAEVPSVLERFQLTGRSLVREHLYGGAPLKTGESSLATNLFELFGAALSLHAQGDPDGEGAKLLALSRKHLAPMLNALATSSTGIDAGWWALPGVDGGVDIDRLLMTGVFPNVPFADALRAMTSALMALTPQNAPDLLGILGEHLRKPFYDTDLVDLEMVGIVLPHALLQLEMAETAENAAAVKEIEGLLVSGLCFGVRSTEQYVSHFTQWMRMARAAGVVEPEARLGRVFRRHPEAAPDIARFYTSASYGSDLINQTARLLDTEERSRSGVRGRLLQTPEWSGEAITADLDEFNAVDQAKLKLDPEQRLVREAFAFVRGLESPSPVTVTEMVSARRLLETIGAEIPPVGLAALGDLLARTQALLDGRAPGSGRREATALARRWGKAFRPGLQPRVAVYEPGAHDDGHHPWQRRADLLAVALGQWTGA